MSNAPVVTVPMDTGTMKAWRRHNLDEDLVRFLRGFDDEEMSATADYLSRLRGPGAIHRVMRSDGIVVD